MTEMLREAGYPGRKVAADVTIGFKIVSDIPPSGIFALEDRPAKMSRAETARTSKWAKDGQGEDWSRTGDYETACNLTKQ